MILCHSIAETRILKQYPCLDPKILADYSFLVPTNLEKQECSHIFDDDTHIDTITDSFNFSYLARSERCDRLLGTTRDLTPPFSLAAVTLCHPRLPSASLITYPGCWIECVCVCRHHWCMKKHACTGRIYTEVLVFRHSCIETYTDRTVLHFP